MWMFRYGTFLEHVSLFYFPWSDDRLYTVLEKYSVRNILIHYFIICISYRSDWARLRPWPSRTTRRTESTSTRGQRSFLLFISSICGVLYVTSRHFVAGTGMRSTGCSSSCITCWCSPAPLSWSWAGLSLQHTSPRPGRYRCLVVSS